MMTGVVIAGGQSSRMGRDKAFLEIGGVPLWQRQAALLRDAGAGEILISANASQDFPGEEMVRDESAGSGPLAGLAACLHRCQNDHLLAIAVDMPNLSVEFLRPLFDCQRPLVFQEHGSRFFEPFPGIYPKSAAAIADRRLRDDDLSLQDFIREIDPEVRVITPEMRPFFQNWNTPGEVTP